MPQTGVLSGMQKREVIILMSLILLRIFVSTKNAVAQITVPSNVYFHLWQQNTYINFASPTSLDNIVLASDKLHLDQYWFNVESANLTISELFTSYQLIFTVKAPSETTSITGVYVKDWGEPTSAYANGTLTWSYETSTKTLTFTVIHSSHVEIVVDWAIIGDMDRDGDVDSADLSILADVYGSEVGQPDYNPEADMDGDGDIDVGDLYSLARNYGETKGS